MSRRLVENVFESSTESTNTKNYSIKTNLQIKRSFSWLSNNWKKDLVGIISNDTIYSFVSNAEQNALDNHLTIDVLIWRVPIVHYSHFWVDQSADFNDKSDNNSTSNI